MAAGASDAWNSVPSVSNAKMDKEGPLIFYDGIKELVKKTKVLVVGAGGIGCELLKNLVLTGFDYIEVIDLDTIEVSNLNRQFLFTKKDVGKSKAEVARASVLEFSPNTTIKAHHGSVTSAEYGVGFISKFNIVLNALDNKAARNHVNRVCLAAGVPLVESGTAGYNGQVELILKPRTKCYECDPKPPAKTYPGCTIRNTPTQIIHCIVWAKHLFNQLFGEHDPNDEDNDVSPDPQDTEVGAGDSSNTPRLSTREWAKEKKYAPEKLFNKLFDEDIRYLLSLSRLWETRVPPSPLTWEDITSPGPGEMMYKLKDKSDYAGIPDQKVWTLSECADIFSECLDGLKKKMDESPVGFIVWDKDDKFAMDFVASAANIRASIFGIDTKSLFDIKSMAGNIIPAVSTSNAIVAGLVVLTAINVLRGAVDQCQTVYIRSQPGPRGKILIRERYLEKPNPKCAVCSDKPKVTIITDVTKMKCKEFETAVLKEKLNMIAPDIQLDSTGAVIISSEEGETEQNNDKTLSELGICDGTILLADDFVQNYKVTIILRHRELGRDDPSFFVEGDISDVKPLADEKTENGKDSGGISGIGETVDADEDEDDVMVYVEDDSAPKKRKQDEGPSMLPVVPTKKRRTADNSRAIK